jgi:hypothetical protein
VPRTRAPIWTTPGLVEQPGERPAGVVSRALDEMLTQDGFKKK